MNYGPKPYWLWSLINHNFHPRETIIHTYVISEIRKYLKFAIEYPEKWPGVPLIF